jgi:hypothetical protein
MYIQFLNISLHVCSVLVRDLQDPSKTDLKIRENMQGKNIVCGVTQTNISDVEGIQRVLQRGAANRTTGATDMV